MSKEWRAEGIVLGVVDYGDADRVVTFFTRERGKIPAFAAGARKSKRRFAGALEPFTRLELRLRQGRGDLPFLQSCQIRDAHPGLREDLGRLAHAGHAAELCRELCREREPHEELFELLAAYLGTLGTSEAALEDLLAFELAALRHAGLAPRFEDCALCGRALAEDQGGLCDPAHGGMICAACADQAHPGAFPIAAEARLVASALQQAGPFAGSYRPASVSAAARARVRELVRRFTHHHLGKRLRSLDFIEQLGIEG